MSKHRYTFSGEMLTALLDKGLELQDGKNTYQFELDPELTDVQIYEAYGKALESRVKRKLQLEAVKEQKPLNGGFYS